MPVKDCLIFKCINMDIEEGKIENEYDFAEDAMDFEDQLAGSKSVTFTHQLTSPLTTGSYIVCTGTPSADIPWFAINIGSGDVDSGKADIAVHFNVRTPQCYIVRNTRKGNKWGPEETTSFRRFPFMVDRKFTIEAVIDDTRTLFAVDGMHYCSYEHRQPAPAAAAWVQVTGVRDAELTVSNTELYPVLAPPIVQVPKKSSIDDPVTDDEPSWHPNITAALPEGIPEGYQLVIHARLRPMLHSFVMELVESVHEWPAPGVALHGNLRAHVDAHLPRQLLVLNTWRRAAGWGAERRQRTARLIPGTTTTLRIVRAAQSWQVLADSLLLGELEQRHDAAAVAALRLRGDLLPLRLLLCPANPSSPTSLTCPDVCADH